MPEQKRVELRYWTRRYKFLIITGIILLVIASFPVPDYKPPYSKALYSREGILLSATTSADQQWCFPLNEEIPEAFKTCLLLYEDEYFYWHPGINPISVVKAAIVNYRAKRIVRGASTLNMQLMRMKNRHSKRNYGNKIYEAFGALKYSLYKSKKTILKEWAEIAPFGGNTIGLKAASLRYFGTEPSALSWSEYALLAVMPNTPGTANISVNRDILREKRNRLLQKLHQKSHFSQTDLEIFMDEDLPEELFSIPQEAYHLLQFASQNEPDKHLLHSTVHHSIQQKLNMLTDEESRHLQIEDIHNLAAVIIDLEDNSLVAYVGNVARQDKGFNYVDVAQALRSYGSLLKPILYAEALETGFYLPQEMIPDIPTAIGDFRPKNFDRKFRGVAGMDEMLIQSLNVPAVRVLHTIGIQGFYQKLRKLNVRGIDRGADHYGLSIILGGAESTLWDMCRLYKGLALNYYGQKDPFKPVNYILNEPDKSGPGYAYGTYSIKNTIRYMSDVVRPREERAWSLLSSSSQIAWKTGTSYGHRDAWAIGFNGRYAVGVWVGNEEGEGRFNLTGISRAAPIMFKIFSTLKNNKWFEKEPKIKSPINIKVCEQSGKISGPLCTKTMSLQIENESHKYQTCPYHTVMDVTEDGYIVGESCKELAVKRDTFFVLPPSLEYYYRHTMPSYMGLSKRLPDCESEEMSIQVIYPEKRMKILLPKDRPDKKNQLIARAYHSEINSAIYWFFNGVHYCTTQSGKTHECILDLEVGKYTMTLIDQYGNTEAVEFEILNDE